MGTQADVKERLPGLQFRVEESRTEKKTIDGRWHGRILLHCEYDDRALFEAAANKLNGFKIFCELAEELTDALGEELDNTVSELEAKTKELEEMKKQLELEQAETARLRGLLASIDRELDGLP